MYNYEETLIHHGIRGQKWGIRRYRNYDGTLTNKGKKRYDYDDNDNTKSSKKLSTKQKVAIGAGVATGVLVTTAVLNPEGAKKVAYAIGKVGGKTAKNVEKRLVKAGDKMVDAALISAGSIVAAKAVSKISDKPTDSESTKNVKKIARDSVSAGINTAFGSNHSNNGNNNNSNKSFKSSVGEPKGDKVDKQSKEYAALFNGVTDNGKRGDIKAMVNQGYSIEQIQEYLKHGGILLHSSINNCIIRRGR